MSERDFFVITDYLALLLTLLCLAPFAPIVGRAADRICEYFADYE